MTDALLTTCVPLVLSGVVFFEDRIHPPALRRGVHAAVALVFVVWVFAIL